MHVRRARNLLPSAAIVATWLLSITVAGLSGIGPASRGSSGVPPDDWVYLPTELDPDFWKMECTFPFPSNVDPTFHPSAACQEKEWGKSGILREQGRDFHVTSVPACADGPGDLDFIRLCNVDWISQTSQKTPWGFAGPNGCVPIRVTFTCGL